MPDSPEPIGKHHSSTTSRSTRPSSFVVGTRATGSRWHRPSRQRPPSVWRCGRPRAPLPRRRANPVSSRDWRCSDFESGPRSASTAWTSWTRTRRSDDGHWPDRTRRTGRAAGWARMWPTWTCSDPERTWSDARLAARAMTTDNGAESCGSGRMRWPSQSCTTSLSRWSRARLRSLPTPSLRFPSGSFRQTLFQTRRGTLVTDYDSVDTNRMGLMGVHGCSRPTDDRTC